MKTPAVFTLLAAMSATLLMSGLPPAIAQVHDVAVTQVTPRLVNNGGFEKDGLGTAFDDISGWEYELLQHQGNPATGNQLEVVGDAYYSGGKSVYSYLQTTSVPPGPGDSIASQVFTTEAPVAAAADYISLWIGEDGYTTSSRYYWFLQLRLLDGTNQHSEVLRCDCWGNHEGCNPNHYDYYDAVETGADGGSWKRYTVEIPGDIDRRNLTVQVWHRQASWDLTTASSWYDLDSVYFSDAAGNMVDPILLVPGDPLTIDVTVENQGGVAEDFDLSTRSEKIVPNSDYEKDPAGTALDDISDWDHNMVVHQGNPPTADQLEVVEDFCFTGGKSVYSYLQTTSVPPGPGDNVVSQDFTTTEPVSTDADHISLWIGGDGHTTSSRYYWFLQLRLSDGITAHGETLCCDCWGNNEGCSPNHYDHYDAIATGDDGSTWKRYTIAIPGDLDKSSLFVTVRHRQASWDLTTAGSWYRLDQVYFSDADGNPVYAFSAGQPVLNLLAGEMRTLTSTWDTTGAAAGDYAVDAHAAVVEGEEEIEDNTQSGTMTRIYLLCQDLNDDGEVNAADLALLLGAWGDNPGHAADYNFDGMVNAADLAMLLGGWGPCP